MIHRKTAPLIHRPRRLRTTPQIRGMVRETALRTEDLVAPLFVIEGKNRTVPVPSMPGCARLSVDLLADHARSLHELGIPAVALFPAIAVDKKNPTGKEALNPGGLFPQAIRAVKDAAPELLIITDVALDPYSSDGHDGIVREGRIVNDATVDMLSRMAVVQAEAGADIVAPSDMMDGRVLAIRQALDETGFTDVAIMAYTAKYASAFYGPFREALDSTPGSRPGVPGNKRTYQMDPANAREAERELMLDLEEGADVVMVKPAHTFLDIIRLFREISSVPVAAYHVSGEYAMIQAAAANGWLDEKDSALEVLTAIKRAGADIILTYFAEKAAGWLHE